MASPKPTKPKASRKRKLPPEEEFDAKDQINLLPDDILLNILSSLPVKERCISGRVCRRWRRIISDNSLWRHVDLLAYRLDLNKMWKVLRAHFSDCLLTMRVKGYVRTGCMKEKKPSVSDAMLNELSNRCPNLKALQLHRCVTANLSFDNLPCSLSSLSLTDCMYQPGWFKGKHAHLPHLTSLNLAGTVRLDKFDLTDIAAFESLKSLNISGCYRVKGGDIEVAAKSLMCLETLDLSNTEVNDLGVHHIARHLEVLKCLVLTRCASLSPSCLATLASGTSNLEVLDISHCGEAITLDALKSLSPLRKLRTLCVIGNKFTDCELKSLRDCFVQNLNIQVEL